MGDKFRNSESPEVKTDMPPELTQTPGSQSIVQVNASQATIYGVNTLPQYVRDAMKADNEKRYGKEFQFQEMESAADLKMTILDQREESAPFLERRATSFAADTLGNATTRDVSMKDVMKIRFRVFDHDMDNDDDFMGSYKVLVGTTDDNSKLHKVDLTKKLVNNQEPKGFDAGSISFRLYFNVVDIWQQHGVRYIDNDAREKMQISIHEDE